MEECVDILRKFTANVLEEHNISTRDFFLSVTLYNFIDSIVRVFLISTRLESIKYRNKGGERRTINLNFH